MIQEKALIKFDLILFSFISIKRCYGIEIVVSATVQARINNVMNHFVSAT